MDATETGDELDNPIPAPRIADQFSRDRERANREFLDEPLTVRGEVLNIANVVSAVVVRVLGTGDRDDGTHIEMQLKIRDDATKINRGKEITFRGVCRGLKENANPTGDDIGWIKFEEAVIVGSAD